MTKSMLVVVGAALALGGCAATPTITPVAIETKLPPVVYQEPQPIHTKAVKWKVYTADNIAELEADLKANGGAVFVLLPQGYKNLNGNIIDAKRYISEQKSVIAFLNKTINDRAKMSSAPGQK